MGHILLIDVGNTSVSLVVMKNKKIVAQYVVLTRQPTKIFKNDLEKILTGILSGKQVTGSPKPAEGRVRGFYPLIVQCIMCSVVPEVDKIIRESVQFIFDLEVKQVGFEVKVPIKNGYDNPKQVGADRLVVAYAAQQLYGQPAVVIDIGTAVTFDVISAKGVYEGGMITPGIRLSAESLFKGTALLPELKEFKTPNKLIGKNTQDSILSGLFYGYAAMCDGLISKLRKKLGQKTVVVLTGGYAPLIFKNISEKCQNDPDLVFKGLSLLAE